MYQQGLRTGITSIVQLPWYGCSIQSSNHSTNIYYARCSGYVVRKTGKTLTLMQISFFFFRKRDIKQIITHINMYLQIVLRKKNLSDERIIQGDLADLKKSSLNKRSVA